MKILILIFLTFTFLSCDDDGSIGTTKYPNILIIVADDLGKDALNGFTEGVDKPNTPNLDALRNSGVTFTNFWTNPTCSPTRSAILTGKYGYRTGVKWANDILSDNETILHKYIKQNSPGNYSTAIIGKWHLSGEGTDIDNPELFGMDYYIGLPSGAAPNYSRWRIYEDGNYQLRTDYITSAFTDLAIDWVNEQSTPWFLWLAYTAPHTPFHVPPSDLHYQGSLPEYQSGMDELPYYLAMIEAMDTEIGRFLSSIPQDERDNTVIIFLGDNGTPNQVTQSPYESSKSKGTIYQGGVNTPLIISGKGVTRIGIDGNLICNTDLFPTISELCGISIGEINDGISFRHLLSGNGNHRDYQYTEMDSGTKDMWTISDGRYKLIVNADGDNEYYDLLNDPYENNDLMNRLLSAEETNALIDLEDELAKIRN